MSRNLRQTVLPVLAALIWGTAFVFQSVSADKIGPFAFNAARSAIASVVLFFVAKMFDSRKDKKPVSAEEKREARKELVIGGISCGVVFTAAANLQQFGLTGTSAGKAAFITTLYVVIVPILGIFLKKKTSLNIWISVAIAVLGLYFLCINESFRIAPTDIYVLACAFAFALHILVIDRFASTVDGVWLSCVQFATATVLSGICALIFEEPNISQFRDCIWSLLYLGVFSSGVAYTLQIIAQKDANPTVVTLLLCLESVFGTLAGAVILHERMTAREYIGCVLMFAAVILAQIPFNSKNRVDAVPEKK